MITIIHICKGKGNYNLNFQCDSYVEISCLNLYKFVHTIIFLHSDQVCAIV